MEVIVEAEAEAEAEAELRGDSGAACGMEGSSYIRAMSTRVPESSPSSLG